MKKKILALISISTIILFGSGLDISEETNVFRQISMCIFDDFLSKNKSLPESFDDIPSLNEWVSRETDIAILVNELAIVPNMPLIRAEQGLLHKFTAYKLFAISRIESFDRVMSGQDTDGKNGGRYSILINSENSDIFSMWIPENQAQLILKQIDGFDPNKQPLAFQNLKNKKPEHDDNLFRQVQPLPSSKADTNSNGIQRKVGVFSWLWILGGVILLASVIGIVICKRR